MKKIILVQFTKTVSQLPFDETTVYTSWKRARAHLLEAEGATISVSGDVVDAHGNIVGTAVELDIHS